MIYLKRLTASQFRIFPEGQTFEFDGPGVTILAGPNGLGKTSVLEAIEWALTGTIRRLESLNDELTRKEHLNRYYARRSMRGIQDTMNVSVEFDDGDNRRQQFVRRWKKNDSNTDRFLPESKTIEGRLDADIAKFLRAEDWGAPIDNLSNYLHNTHLLVQPTGGRWPTLAPEDRWARVEGPAGLQRLEVLRGALGPKSRTRIALKVNLDNCSDRLRSKEQALEGWTSLLKEREAARSAARPGVPTHEAVSDELATLRTRIEKLLSDSHDMVAGDVTDAVDVGQLVLIVGKIDAALTAKRQSLTEAQEIPATWRSINADLAISVQTRDARQRDAAKLTQEREEVAKHLHHMRDNFRVIEQETRSVSERLRYLRRAADATVDRPQTQVKISLDLERVERDLRSSAKRHQVTAEQLTTVAQNQGVRPGATTPPHAVRRLVSQANGWVTGEQELQASVRQCLDDQRVLAEIEQEVERATRAFSVQQDRLRSAESSLAEARKSYDDVKRALVTIVSSITANDKYCPVCKTTFSLGELKEQAMKGAAASDSFTSTLQDLVNELKQSMAQDAQKIDELTRRKAAFDLRIRDLEILTDAQEAKWESIRSSSDQILAEYDRHAGLLKKGVEAAGRDLVDREGHVRAIQSRWNALDLKGEISEAILEFGRQGIQQQKQETSSIQTRLNALREELEREGSCQKVHADIQRRLSAAGVAGEDEFERQLAADVAEAREARHRVEKTIDVVGHLSRKLDEAADGYAKNVGVPLEERTNRFFRALSTFHRRRIVLQSRVTSSGRTELRLCLALDGEEPTEGEGISALHLLSEGQMSEVSLSVMLAMSTSFGWSRWPALLLDDPLQQNDIVHVAAFLDVICNLVRHAGYQVIVSTHDLDLADFMRRKVCALRLPCRLYRFLNPGRAELDVSE